MTSTFDRLMKKSSFKKAFDKEYNELVLSELLCAMMEENKQSVRELAKTVKLSPTVIQKIRSGKQKDMKIKNFVGIAHACGYNVFLEKEGQTISL